jgi:hypothetical protein
MLPQYKSEAPQTTYSSTAKPQLRKTGSKKERLWPSSCSILPSILRLHGQDGDQNGACVGALKVHSVTVSKWVRNHVPLVLKD